MEQVEPCEWCQTGGKFSNHEINGWPILFAYTNGTIGVMGPCGIATEKANYCPGCGRKITEVTK